MNLKTEEQVQLIFELLFHRNPTLAKPPVAPSGTPTLRRSGSTSKLCTDPSFTLTRGTRATTIMTQRRAPAPPRRRRRTLASKLRTRRSRPRPTPRQRTTGLPWVKGLLPWVTAVGTVEDTITNTTAPTALACLSATTTSPPPTRPCIQRPPPCSTGTWENQTTSM